MKILIAISTLASILTIGSVSYGQAVPAGVATITPNAVTPGPNLSALDGVIHYSLSASEIVQYGYYGNGDVTSSAALSGDVAYSTKSMVYPFSLVFAGGVLLPNQSGQGVSTFEDVSVSQGYITRHWVFSISDTFSFLPQSPTTGLSGIPGVGDLGAIPVLPPTESPAGGILAASGDRIGNTLGGSVARQLDSATSISGSGSWSVLHFLDGNSYYGGLDSTQIAGTVALSRRLDLRSTASISAVYSVFSYSGPQAGPSEPNFQTRGINVSYQRVLSRAFSVAGSIGPQWVSSSDSALIPSTLNVAGSASLSYSHRYTNASVSYFRGANGGSGVLPGALSDGVSAGVGRSYGRNWVASASSAYTRSSGLTQIGNGTSFVPVNEVFDTVYGGVQLTRRISNHFSGYVSYTAQNQTNNYSGAAQNALNGTSQTFGIGVSFSPRSTRLGQF